MPPKGALTWPSSEVPVPKGMTGTRASAQSLTNFDHLLRRLGEDHGVGRLAGDPGERVGMLLAERGSGREAIAEPCRKPRKQGSLRLGRGPLRGFCRNDAHGGSLPPLRLTGS